MVWDSHLFQNFPQFIVIHTVKGFGIVNKAEICRRAARNRSSESGLSENAHPRSQSWGHKTQHPGLAAAEGGMVPGLTKLDPHSHALLLPSA